MYNYKLLIEYDGKDYYGWQKQSYTDATIQGQIETAIFKLLKKRISLIGAGRTDAGVNAYNQVANFKYFDKIDLNKFRYSVNSILPESISLKRVISVPLIFHSRYSAKKREYIYKITSEKKSIARSYFYRTVHNLDFSKIDELFQFLKSQKYFRSFCKNRKDRNNFQCDIYTLKYIFNRSKNEIVFKLIANRFLHSMVRAIVGCAIDIGRGKIELNNIKEKIKKGERLSINYLPANGLFLNKIYY